MAKPGLLLIAEKSGHLEDPSGQFMPMLEFCAALQPARQCDLERFVVLRDSNPVWEDWLDQQGMDWGVCPDGAQGLEHLIAFGVHANQHWNGWIIEILQAPATSHAILSVMASALDHFALVGQQQETDRLGFPAAFQSSFGYELMTPGSGLLARSFRHRPDAPTRLGHAADTPAWINLAFRTR